MESITPSVHTTAPPSPPPPFDPTPEQLAVLESLGSEAARPQIVELLQLSKLLDADTTPTQPVTVLDATFLGTLLLEELLEQKRRTLDGIRLVVAVEDFDEKRTWFRQKLEAVTIEAVDILPLHDLSTDSFDYVFCFQDQNDVGAEGPVPSHLSLVTRLLRPTGTLVNIAYPDLSNMQRHERLSSASPPLDTLQFHPSDIASLRPLYAKHKLEIVETEETTMRIGNANYLDFVAALGTDLPQINLDCNIALDEQWAAEGREGLPTIESPMMVLMARKMQSEV